MEKSYITRSSELVVQYWMYTTVSTSISAKTIIKNNHKQKNYNNQKKFEQKHSAAVTLTQEKITKQTVT